ncbi:MAG: TauD/TfdA family dioxygenase [Proteobacteria bacterium]|nr:TauD/TfdA family dioxygenase [Pseudomonadota bacterium]
MAPVITPCDATLGAVITDIDLASLDDATWKIVEDAFPKYGVLVFPGQGLSSVRMEAVPCRFGEIEVTRPGSEGQTVYISNEKEAGKVFSPEETRFKQLRGNEGWHLDSTYMPLAAKAGLLQANVIPSSGGGTEFADTRAAYDALDEAMKKRIAGLSGFHSLYASQAKIGHKVPTGTGYGFHTKGAPLRPLVRTHPVTGRKSLCIGRHIFRIPGMDDDAAVKLVDELVDFACRPPRVYSHKWTVGDLVVWDNRFVMHRAMPYDFNETRILQANRIAGDPASELAPTDRDPYASDYRPTGSNEIEVAA